MRLSEHPILNFERVRGREVTIYFEGNPIKAHEGETIAMALHAAGIRTYQYSTKKHRPRGLFCAIGKCSSCLMKVNGIPNVRTCITLVEDGMQIEMQEEKPLLPETKKPPKWKEPPRIEADVIVVGGGPAGMMAAINASDGGAKVVLLDENPMLGGQLVKQTHKFFGKREQFAGVRGIKIADILEEELRKRNIELFLETSAIMLLQNGEDKLVVGVKKNKELIEFKGKAVVVATGAMERMIPFENNDLPGVYGAGAIQTLMNTYGVKPGDRVLIVGAGNVGLILAYQLYQAGVKVEAIVEAMPKIGGYFVHAAKVRRLGIPILTRHTILRAEGNEKVEKAVVAQLDEKWNVIPGTEKVFEVDVIALAVGLRPSIELLHQVGCQIKYVPELGGHVVIRDSRMETTVKGIFVAGDSAGIEEATTAMLEGKIAGIGAALIAGVASPEWLKEIEKAQKELEVFRSGPFGRKVLEGLRKVVVK
ncbi:MAG TPA: FAD-dependent oxidoreductase [Thermococcaceae archaeon]|uniref:Dye-L-proDH alpha n=2 Tax=Thermococcus sibiricus TaxID=172049 RepID=C6A257_THESM|nr:FAD-dependent oxidoreductase [Thermococcus sibiricus]ACS89702.1 Dye-L-proDH alpha [Thermococcus sibiricus MM 739]KUK17908.1 MAG: Dye-L-proDH alpha [Thermococcus sibiricus]KUK28813.1 MAG: Dye-L-proDH alpha [Thermococcus sp. 40_45]HII67577.1 FAD-dependent oxidoreductase [Thermococcaceae archaeon]